MNHNDIVETEVPIMSGRGRGRGTGSGRGGGRGFRSGRSNNNKTNTSRRSDDKDKDKIKFAPFYSGKTNQQNVTYDTVKDHVLKQIQKTYKFGSDLTYVLEKEEDYVDLDAFWTVTELDLPAKKATDVTQYDAIEYQEMFRERRERKKIYDDNKKKGYAFILTYCNTTMQTRIESDSDFESKIKNNPFELLKAIKKKMYDPSKTKYPLATFTDHLDRLMSVRQQEDETLIDYVKKFKQHRDNAREIMGDNFLE